MCKKCYLKWYKNKNKSKIFEYHKKYREEHKTELKEYNRLWIQNNLGKHAAKEAKRRAAKMQATPKWANLEKIKEIYNNCPKGYHVDHIIPLKGKNICGLHIETNLQYLPAIDNLKKGNRA